jgi:site-specific recombinase XerD
MGFVKNHLEIHRNLLSKNDPLFTNNDGTPITSSCITTMIKEYNYITFEKIMFSAKSLRHNYITNAIDEGHNLDQISKSVGHKSWRATMHYLHRSIRRLLDNTLKYNPVKGLF